MTTTKHNFTTAACLTVCGWALTCSRPAGAQPVVLDNFKLLGHTALPGASAHGDVAFFDHKGKIGKFAYVGTWVTACSGTGVKIVDVNDPRSPRVVATAGDRPGTAHDDPVVRRIPRGRGGHLDLLAFGSQPCGPDGVSGLELYDVTDPARPAPLSFFPTPTGIHELDVVVRPDGRVLALVACPYAELNGAGGDFRIIEISDPLHPSELANWGIIANSSLPIVAGQGEISSVFQGIGYLASYFAQFTRAADNGMTAYVAYFDGGVLKFDLTDPAHPRLVGRTTYPSNAEGNAIYAATYDVRGQRYLLQSDEDIDSTGLSPVDVSSSATASASYAGLEEFWLPTILSQTGPITAAIYDAGDGCDSGDFDGAAGRIVLVDAPDPFYFPVAAGCTVGDQVLRAARAGAKAVLLNLVSFDDAWPFTAFGYSLPSPETLDAIVLEVGGMPAVQISSIDGLAERIRAGLANGSVTVTLAPNTPGTGFLRVFGEATGSDADGDGVLEYTQVGTFAGLPHVLGELASPPGWWGIHGTEVNGDRAYAGWFSHGVVALDISNPRRPKKAGQFVPPGDPASVFPFFAGPVVWGVAVDPDTGILYVSDMGSGLWIVKPQGSAQPSQ